MSDEGTSDKLQGIVHMIDAIQDTAEETYPKDVVFPILNDEEREELDRYDKMPLENLPLHINDDMYPTTRRYIKERIDKGE